MIYPKNTYYPKAGEVRKLLKLRMLLEEEDMDTIRVLEIKIRKKNN